MRVQHGLSKAQELCELMTKCPQGSYAFKGEPDQVWLCPHGEHGYTGQVPLLDPKLVRVECPPLKDGHCLHGLNFPCRGLGWMPSTDPWAYVRAAWPLLPNQQQRDGQAQVLFSVEWALDEGDDPGPEVFAMVAEALLKEKP